jgi:hypothetical protein
MYKENKRKNVFCIILELKTASRDGKPDVSSMLYSTILLPGLWGRLPDLSAVLNP